MDGRESIKELNTCIGGLEQGLVDLNNAIDDLTIAFDELKVMSELPTKYKCPQCGNVLYVHNITEVDVIFYCKNCDKKVRGKL